MIGDKIKTYINKISSDVQFETSGQVDPTRANTVENVLVVNEASNFASIQNTVTNEFDEKFLYSCKKESSVLEICDSIGITRKPATFASGVAVFQGTVGTAITNTTQFVGNNGSIYTSTSNTVIANIQFTILAASRVNNIVTIQTNGDHGFTNEQIATISGFALADLNKINIPIQILSINQFSYFASGIDIVPGSLVGVSVSTNMASVNIVAETAGIDGNLNGLSELNVLNPIVGLNSTGGADFLGITGGADAEDILTSLRARGIEAQQVFSSNVGGDNFSVAKLTVLLKQNTPCTRAWVYQALNDTEAGFVTTVSVNDNQTPIALNGAQLAQQVTYLNSLKPAYLPEPAISCLTANLIPINITINGLLNNSASLQQAIENELKTFFTTIPIFRLLQNNLNLLTQVTIETAIQNTVDPTTNARPSFTSATTADIPNLVNDNDLAILGTLTIN